MKNVICRAKAKHNNEFVYGIPFVDGFGNWCMHNPEGSKDIIVVSESLSIGTGFLDKNNMEIFEGDVVAIPSNNSDLLEHFVVLYDKYEMAFMLYRVNKNSNTFLYVGRTWQSIRTNWSDYCVADVEVIGNVWDIIPRLRQENIFEED